MGAHKSALSSIWKCGADDFIVRASRSDTPTTDLALYRAMPCATCADLHVNVVNLEASLVLENSLAIEEWYAENISRGAMPMTLQILVNFLLSRSFILA